MPLATVAVSRRGDNDAIAVVRLNRPERLNAMSLELVDDLHEVFSGAQDSPIAGARVVVFLGNGRAFCAGADLAANANGSGGRMWNSKDPANQERFSSLIVKMRAVSQPIVCGVQGAAGGGGMGLALAADVRVAAKSALFIPSFLNIGLSGCELGTSFFLPKMIGISNASFYLMTGESISAQDAYRMGMVSKIVEDAQLEEACVAIATKMLDASPLGLMLTKRQLSAASDGASLAATIHTEDVRQILCLLDEPTQKITAAKARRFIEAKKAKANL